MRNCAPDLLKWSKERPGGVRNPGAGRTSCTEAVIAERTCSIPGCERPFFGRGWCTTHFGRWRRHGDPLYERPKVCIVPECGQPVRSRGWCSQHYDRWRTYGDPTAPTPPRKPSAPKPKEPCAIRGCRQPHLARGWCSMHYSRWKRYGDPLKTSGPGRIPKALKLIKDCRKCGQAKTLSEFYLQNINRDGRMGSCKTCIIEERRQYRLANLAAVTAYRKAWYEANREKVREQHRRRRLLKKYGITPEEYGQRLAQQDGCCASCGTDQPGGRHGYFAVDHDHGTGKVRALLCFPCNVGIGVFGENPARLIAAAAYLLSFQRQREKVTV